MPLNETIDKLASFEPTDLPVISLYLNTQADQHGRDNFDSFVRKEFKAKSQTFPLRSPARLSFDKDTERINAYLGKLRPSANGVAIFACAGANDFFEAVELDAPICKFPCGELHRGQLPSAFGPRSLACRTFLTISCRNVKGPKECCSI